MYAVSLNMFCSGVDSSFNGLYQFFYGIGNNSVVGCGNVCIQFEFVYTTQVIQFSSPIQLMWFIPVTDVNQEITLYIQPPTVTYASSMTNVGYNIAISYARIA